MANDQPFAQITSFVEHTNNALPTALTATFGWGSRVSNVPRKDGLISTSRYTGPEEAIRAFG